MTQGKPGNGLNFEALRLGIERCDPEFVLGFYVEDAKLSIVNAVTPRAAPFELHGKARALFHAGRGCIDANRTEKFLRGALLRKDVDDAPVSFLPAMVVEV